MDVRIFIKKYKLTPLESVKNISVEKWDKTDLNKKVSVSDLEWFKQEFWLNITLSEMPGIQEIDLSGFTNDKVRDDFFCSSSLKKFKKWGGKFKLNKIGRAHV